MTDFISSHMKYTIYKSNMDFGGNEKRNRYQVIAIIVNTILHVFIPHCKCIFIVIMCFYIYSIYCSKKQQQKKIAY